MIKRPLCHPRRPQLVTQVVSLNSKDASFDASGDWMFSFPYLGLTNVKSIQLIDYQIYWSWKNVLTTTNTFVFDEGGSNISFTIPSGNYLIDDITTAIEAGMNTNGTQAYTVSFSNVTGLITISGISSEFTIHYPATTMSSLIGLTASITSIGYSLILQQFADLQTVKWGEIHLPQLITSYESNMKSNDLIYKISLDNSSFGSILEHLTIPSPKIEVNRHEYTEYCHFVS